MITGKRIRPHLYDWHDKVALWRGRAPKQRAVSFLRADVTYYFGIRRFVHSIDANTLCQMEVVKPVPYTAT